MGLGAYVSECVCYIRLANEIINSMLCAQYFDDKIIIDL